MKKILFIFLSTFLISCRSEQISLDDFNVNSDQKKKIEYLLDIITKESIEELKEVINENDIDINFVDNNGKTLILLSLLNEKITLTKLLLELGADPNARKAAFK